MNRSGTATFWICMLGSVEFSLTFLRTLSAAKGMAYLEEQGVIHRDIALRNLLVSIALL